MKCSATLSCVGLIILSVTNINCYRLRGSQGGGQIEAIAPRTIDQKDIAIQPGYRIEPVVSGLNFPTAVAFDDQNQLYVIEAGYSYGEVFDEPKLLRVDGDKTTLIAKGTKNGPWTGITWYDGASYTYA